MQRFWNYARKLENGQPVAGATVNVYLKATLTPATIYADDHVPPTPLANPLTADNNGFFFFYAHDGRYDVRLSLGTPHISIPYTWGDNQLATPLSQVFDVQLGYGAIGDFSHDDTANIQAAINAAVAAGGGIIYFPAGHYKITAPLTLNMGTAAVSVQLWGASRIAVIIEQVTANTDVFQLGVTSAEACDFLHMCDISIHGGRYGLNLNNVLASVFERLQITNCSEGIYGQGTNESNIFRDIAIVGCAVHGIHFGALNNAVIPYLDLPECQKSVFENVRVANTVGGEAIYVTAGFAFGAQQISAHNTFRRILLEGNHRTGMLLEWGEDTAMDGLTNEDNADADDVYAGLIISQATTLSLSNCSLVDSRNANKYGYTIEVLSSTLFLSNATISPSKHGLMQVSGAVHVTNTYLPGGITGPGTITWANQASQDASSFVGILDGAGVSVPGQVLVPGRWVADARSIAVNGLRFDGGSANTIYNGASPIGLGLTVDKNGGGTVGIHISPGTGHLHFDGTSVDIDGDVNIGGVVHLSLLPSAVLITDNTGLITKVAANEIPYGLGFHGPELTFSGTALNVGNGFGCDINGNIFLRQTNGVSRIIMLKGSGTNLIRIQNSDSTPIFDIDPLTLAGVYYGPLNITGTLAVQNSDIHLDNNRWFVFNTVAGLTTKIRQRADVANGWELQTNGAKRITVDATGNTVVWGALNVEGVLAVEAADVHIDNTQYLWFNNAAGSPGVIGLRATATDTLEFVTNSTLCCTVGTAGEWTFVNRLIIPNSVRVNFSTAGGNTTNIGVTSSASDEFVIETGGVARVLVGATGGVRFAAYGAGTATFDASGNITSVSDERLKTGFRRFRRGLFAVLGLRPILHKWSEASGYETAHEYVGFGAGQVRRWIPETVGQSPRGFLSLSDRGILAALVNGVKTQTLLTGGLLLWVLYLTWRR